MAKSDLLTSLSSLEKKVEKLSLKLSSLQEQIQNLQNDNKALEEQHLADQREISLARREIEFLSLSYRLANSPEALIQARKNISRLIRTIDNCIRLIGEELV